MTAKGFRNVITVARVLVVILLCSSCREADTDSQRVLTRPEMVHALTEIYLSEQKVNRLGLQRDSAELEFQRFKEIIFENIGVSDSVFKRSFDYYMDRPKEMEMIYTALVDSLSLMEQRIDSSNK
jgi:hypothetical protein